MNKKLSPSESPSCVELLPKVNKKFGIASVVDVAGQNGARMVEPLAKSAKFQSAIPVGWDIDLNDGEVMVVRALASHKGQLLSCTLPSSV